jgi:hypothetical protein
MAEKPNKKRVWSLRIKFLHLIINRSDYSIENKTIKNVTGKIDKKNVLTCIWVNLCS